MKFVVIATANSYSNILVFLPTKELAFRAAKAAVENGEHEIWCADIHENLKIEKAYIAEIVGETINDVRIVTDAQ